jgi:hypothetical protein
VSNAQGYDFIGDIHGHHDKLSCLLARLGYEATSGAGFRHPEGRKVVFLGDYIDRGPKVRPVLQTVRAMVEGGDALAILGNHEHVAILYHTPDGNGGWLRPPWLRHGMGLANTISQFEGMEDEWREWLAWLRTLPLHLDLGAVRAVHACWDDQAIGLLGDRRLQDDALLQASAKRGSAGHAAVERVLNGPEMTIPDGALILNARGMPLPYTRVRWWDIPKGRVDLADLALPEPLDGRGEADPDLVAQLPDYPADAPPVFIGHYWLSPDKDKKPLRHNITCLDYSAAKNGPLVAYRWSGESTLTADHFVTS